MSLASPEVPGQGDGLVADALHQAAVAGHGVGVVIDGAVAEAGVHEALGQGHADGVGQPLAEGPGRRLDARRVAVLGVAGGARPELAEVLQLIEGHVLVAGEVEQGIKEHRAVARREDKSVAVRPLGRPGIELQERVKRTVAASAMPMGIPGWPDLAFSTASAAKKRMALAMS